MKIKLNTRDVGQLLERSSAHIDNRTAYKLQAAREEALRHQRTRSQTNLTHWLGDNVLAHSHVPVKWGLAVLFVTILFGGSLYWQSINEHDHAEIDIAILTDDLPVEMYVD